MISVTFPIARWFDDVISFIYPRLCVGCERVLHRNDEMLCMDCLLNLPRTHFSKQNDNMVARMFWGRVHIEYAISYLYFNKGGTVQHMIHQLKYKNRTEVGIYLGSLIGHELKRHNQLSKVDAIIPVPLHYSKLKLRGYNQSEMIAKGLSRSMGIPLDVESLIRVEASGSQTRKNRYQRWENVKQVFDVRNPDQLKGKHIILVDDVITTGATLEACAMRLQMAEAVKVSVVTIACTSI